MFTANKLSAPPKLVTFNPPQALYENEVVTDAALLDHIARLPHARANFKQLVRETGAKGESRIELETALARLAARGELVELRSGHFVATARSLGPARCSSAAQCFQLTEDVRDTVRLMIGHLERPDLLDETWVRPWTDGA